MECKGRHGTLVADVENDLIVDVDTVVQPLYLWRCNSIIVGNPQQGFPTGMLLQVVFVQAAAAGVGKEQGELEVAVGVREVSRVGIDGSLVQRLGLKA